MLRLLIAISICLLYLVSLSSSKLNAVTTRSLQKQISICNCTESAPLSQKIIAVLPNSYSVSVASRNIAKLAIVASAIAYGSTYALTKQLQKNIDASTATFLRFFVAFLPFIPSIATFRGNIGLFLGSLHIGLWCALGFISQAYTLDLFPASKAAFYCGLGAVLPPVFDIIWNQWQAFHGISIKSSPQGFMDSLFAGVLAVLGTVALESGDFHPPAFEDFLLLVPPFSFAMCFWLSEGLAKKHPGYITFTTGMLLATTTISALGCSWVLGDLSLSVAGLQSVIRNPSMLLQLGYLGLVGTAGTAMAEQVALQIVSASEVALIYALEPVFAAAFAVLLLGEHIGLSTAVGACFIVAACTLEVTVPAARVLIQRLTGSRERNGESSHVAAVKDE